MENHESDSILVKRINFSYYFFIEFFSRNWAIITFFIIAVALFRQVIYYDNFNINILNYIEISEVLNYSLDEFIFILSIVLIEIIFIILLSSILRPFIKTKREDLRDLHIWIPVYIMVFGVFIFKIFYQLDTLAFMVTLILLTGVSVSTLEPFRKGYLLMVVPLMTMLIISLIIGVLGFSETRASTLIKNGNLSQTIIYLDDRTQIKSDSNFIYVGQTSNYIFFFSIKDDKATIYSKDKVTSMQINDGPEWFDELFKEREKRNN